MAMTWRGDEAARRLRSRVALKVRLVADLLLQYGQEECPVDTGSLRESGRVVPGPDDLSFSVVFTGDEGRNYAFFVEFGTIRWDQPPNPFFRRAIARVHPEARRIFSEP